MLVRVDEASELPLYAQIANSVRGDIAAGRVVAGQVLPPAREVAAGLEINVHTVLRAYQLLRDEGLVDLKRRRGAVITDAAGAVAELRGDVSALLARAAQLGVSPALLAAVVAATPPPTPPTPLGRAGDTAVDAAGGAAHREAA
ncbi:GntR family transcriptional regulator [Leucobacter luti]|uniref:DNA-binding transcriptional regulator YhcF (GntR family) n=1 Tax=Leucobacter luti TaxID=340320 RepID=A0A4Q7U4X9_9MICO|nr:GntR family transcriptional regulator [Leucobacter luti]MBL3700648.1 GntR family transcriptional regulator [Leucobacter luti]RZT68513.1 DNA-binding transcriptional regulator YhcF (GntR family) [Leucobacter luti]